ncbi:alpha-1,3-rhamnosyl/mannosyltransferase [Catalinimonas alkaloidigena]|uniref:Alpha-1,3-rhamnosyl/mannosyltransferase n=1 Tax=Catalinimonas alkaloidigena TaxID=1075417 RepID=A0A1G9S3X3_9BACT|nr:glycosyltransferase family 1 protein [Catalinimonas alkaloidigena]SDM30248.1 alpha-1,3-rhamnosyl/mannosyltransferase [Catalinimonas alkaloidigena]
MKRVDLEASTLLHAHPTGIARYGRQLIDHLLTLPAYGHDFRLRLLYKLSRFSKRAFRYAPPQASTDWHLGAYFPLSARKRLVHCLDSVLIYGKGIRTVVTIHDLAVFRPEHQLEGYTSDKFREKSWARMRQMVRHADHLIAVSEATKRDLLHFFDYPEAQISVVPLGTEQRPLGRQAPPLPPAWQLHSKQYYLFVGSISVRKNMLNLLQAFAHHATEHTLVLAGTAEPAVLEAIARLRLHHKVRLLGYVEDALLPLLYHHAAAFLFPTYYEGFGIPLLEAMIHRLPIVTSNRGAAPEVVDASAQLVDPFEVDSIREGLEKIATVADTALDAAQQRALAFTWSRTAQSTYEVYQKLWEAH